MGHVRLDSVLLPQDHIMMYIDEILCFTLHDKIKNGARAAILVELLNRKIELKKT